jgi:hypothetical protein
MRALNWSTVEYYSCSTAVLNLVHGTAVAYIFVNYTGTSTRSTVYIKFTKLANHTRVMFKFSTFFTRPLVVHTIYSAPAYVHRTIAVLKLSTTVI